MSLFFIFHSLEVSLLKHKKQVFSQKEQSHNWANFLMLASDNIKSQSKWDKVAVYADITTKF